MKYYRKQPVEAIQWTGDNQMEVSDFIHKAARRFVAADDGHGKLIVCYMDSKDRKHLATIPKFGWVAIEGKTLQFYKDETFKKTFKAAEEDSKGIDWAGMSNTINKAFENFDDLFKGFHGMPKEHTEWYEKHPEPFIESMGKQAKIDTSNSSNDEMEMRIAALHAKDIAEYFKNITISREEAEKYLLGCITFDSVLDKMKELHAKKNKDYGDAFHKSFMDFGPTAGVVRLNDKMERVKSLVKNGKAEVKDESILDSLEDLACYAVMLYVELKNRDNGKL